MAQSILHGKYAVFHDSMESIAQLSLELEEETRYMEDRVPTMLEEMQTAAEAPNEDDLHWLSGNTQWVTLFQRLNPDNPRSAPASKSSASTLSPATPPRHAGLVLEQVVFWKRPRHSRSPIL